MRIGKIDVGVLALAPMAAVNCRAFLEQCKSYGADLVYTQMYHTDTEFDKMIDAKDCLRPLVVQLIGNSPKKMAAAARRAEHIADIIDINFGCIISEELAKKRGAYFLKQPEQMHRLVSSVVDAVDVPVTAKIRLGWDKPNCVDTAKVIEEAGASAIAIHARTKTQAYTGNARANWGYLKKVKNEVKIPVIGNGDVEKPSHVRAMLDYNGCDGVMVGRAAMKNPYIFRQCKDYLNNGKYKTLSKKKQFEDFLRFYSKQRRQSLNEIKDHALWISKGLGKNIKKKIINSKTADSILRLF